MRNSVFTLTSDYHPTTTDVLVQTILLGDGSRIPLGPEIGAGGFGTVHRCTVGTTAAVAKVLHIGSDEQRFPSAYERLQTEEHCLRTLTVPAVPRLLGNGTVNTQPCIVMEHVDGHSWRSLLKVMPGKRFPWHILLRTSFACARTLEGIHDADIVHGDIKPENILLGRARNAPHSLDAWIIDFGLARRMLTEETRMTMEGHMLGTHGFMDPAVLWNAADRNDASDVFALGVTFFEAWKGSPLFMQDIWRRVLSNPEEARTHVTVALQQRKRFEKRYAALLGEMLHPQPEKRPGCSDIRRELGKLGGNTRIAAPQPSANLSEYSDKLCRSSYRVLPRLAGIATVVTVGLGSLFLLPTKQDESSTSNPPPQPLDTIVKPADGPALELPFPSLPKLHTLARKEPALQSSTMAVSHEVHVFSISTEDLCRLLEEGKTGTSIGIPKRKEYPATLYILRPNEQDEECVLQLTRGCFYSRGETRAFHKLTDLGSEDAKLFRQFLEQWRKIDRCIEPDRVKDLLRANEYLRDVKKAAGVK